MSSAAKAAPNIQRAVETFDLTTDSVFERLQKQLGLLDKRAQTAPVRAATLVAIAWAVPLATTIASGTALEFVADWSVWARFVLAIAVFVLMERIVDERLRVHLRQFVDTPLLAPKEMPKAAEAVELALRRGRLTAAELSCLVLAYALSFAGAYALLGREHMGWVLQGSAEAPSLTFAAWWCVLVSGPIFWFLLSRWLWRHFVWGLLLRDLARLELRLVVTHPDGVGGLAFIGQYPNVFAALVFAMTSALAAAIARAFQQEALTLQAYTWLMSGWLIFVVLLFAIPLAAFSKPLTALKERTLLAASAQATRRFRAQEREILGSNLAAADDADSVKATDVADPSALYAAAKKLGTVPFSRTAVTPLGAASLLPLIAAGATQLPFQELLKVAKRLLLF